MSNRIFLTSVASTTVMSPSMLTSPRVTSPTNAVDAFTDTFSKPAMPVTSQTLLLFTTDA